MKRLRGEWGSEPEGEEKKNQTNKTKGKKLNLQPLAIKKAADARRFPTGRLVGTATQLVLPLAGRVESVSAAMDCHRLLASKPRPSTEQSTPAIAGTVRAPFQDCSFL